MDNLNEPLPAADVFVFNAGDTIDRAFTNIDGRVSFNIAEYDSIQITYIGLAPVSYYGKSDRLEVKMELSGDEMFKLNNEQWEISGKSLFDPRFKDQKRRNKYKKTTATEVEIKS